VPRALTIKRTVVPLAARKTYLARLKVRRDYYKLADCNFWVFEEADLPGAFIEFTEAADARALTAAHANAPDVVFDATRVYREVEIE
jgi:hypothetical protein